MKYRKQSSCQGDVIVPIVTVQGISQQGLLPTDSFKPHSALTSQIKLRITGIKWGADTEIALKPSSKDKQALQAEGSTFDSKT